MCSQDLRIVCKANECSDSVNVARKSASSCNLQNALRDVARVRIKVWLRVRNRFRSACAILKLRSAFCKLRRLTNHAQHDHDRRPAP